MAEYRWATRMFATAEGPALLILSRIQMGECGGIPTVPVNLVFMASSVRVCSPAAHMTSSLRMFALARSKDNACRIKPTRAQPLAGVRMGIAVLIVKSRSSR